MWAKGSILQEFYVILEIRWLYYDIIVHIFLFKSTSVRAFIGSFQNFVDLLQTYGRYEFMWKFDAEKNILFQKDRVFKLASLWQLVLVNNDW